ncbi:MAG: hypothetical protein K6F82_05585 [Sphaerochaetaceae bacterium]|nr:hypothetical protein [Sphaerochaetaceae bacterium]
MSDNKENKDNKAQAEKAYIYLVKVPGSNDVCVCASDSVYYPGTYVVAPTRYGMDIAIIVGPADNLDGEKYTPGCAEVRGACSFCPSSSAGEEDDLKAMGEPPEFEFKPYAGEPELEEEKAEETEEAEFTPSGREPEMVEVDGDVLWISHIASPDEIKRYNANIEEEKNAVVICREKIAERKLNMKLVNAHFMLCEPKVLFFFTAEDRVDFRDLVKDLVSVFRMRIELRQIGVRDEARMLGGLAVCGRDFCCHCVSDKLRPVTIKMAKEQSLSLNSVKISGPCGRLLCCLSYEYDFYNEEKQSYPHEGTKLKVGEDLYRIQDINILSRKVTVTGSEGRSFQIPRQELYFSRENNRWEVSREFQEEFN